jgi:hypothetical protein
MGLVFLALGFSLRGRVQAPRSAASKRSWDSFPRTDFLFFAAMGNVMAEVTYYVALPFVASEDGVAAPR